MLRFHMHWDHRPLQHLELHSFQFIPTKRAGEAAITFAEEFRGFLKCLESWRGAPLAQDASGKTDVFSPIVVDHIHGETALIFVYLKACIAMHAGKQASAK